VFSLRPLLGLAVWVDHFQKARAILRDLDQIAIGAQLLPCLWIRAEDGGTAMREHGPHLEAAGASESLDPHPDERDWPTRLDRTLPHKPRHTLNGIEPAAVLSCVLRAAPPRKPIRPSDREGVRFGQGFTKHAICQKCRP
jgi:hypothetical protein